MRTEAPPTVPLRPFSDNHCPACGSTLASLTYCARRCVPSVPGHGHPAFVDVTRVGEAPDPHLHKTCQACRYEWLSECRGAAL
jgi:hypothetical protein